MDACSWRDLQVLRIQFLDLEIGPLRGPFFIGLNLQVDSQTAHHQNADY